MITRKTKIYISKKTLWNCGENTEKNLENFETFTKFDIENSRFSNAQVVGLNIVKKL